MVSRSDPLPASLTRSRGFPRVEPETLRRYAPVIAAFVVSRLVIAMAAILVEAGTFVVNPRLTHGDPAPILRSLTTWDGDWFVGIARNGYHLEAFGDTGYHDYAFFPLYPMLVRILALPSPQLVGLIAAVLNAVLFAIALVLLVRLARRHIGRGTRDPGRGAARDLPVLVCVLDGLLGDADARVDRRVVPGGRARSMPGARESSSGWLR